MKINTEKKSVHSKVIDGIYETNKMLLKIGENTVTKFFKPKSHAGRRYFIEKEALSRLKGIPGTPELVFGDDTHRTIEMTRLPGRAAENLSAANVQALSTIVDNMLQVGVARHSMPIRDIVVDNQGNLGLVDFERATLRKSRWRLDWLIAKQVSYYHLYRLIYEYQPQLLSPRQWKQVYWGGKLKGLVRFMHSLSN